MPPLSARLDAVIIFHNELEDVFRLCEEFQKYHPRGKVHLSIDGNEYPLALKSLNANLIPRLDPMQFLYDQRNVDCSKSYYREASRISQNKKIMWAQLKRLEAISLASDADQIVFLEYDSKVRAAIGSPAPFDVTTIMPNKYSHNFRKQLAAIRGDETEAPEGWGFVTDVLKTEALRKSVKWSKSEGRDILNSLVMQNPGMTVLDFLVPVLFYLSGSRVGKSSQTLECNRTPLWMFRASPLVHQFRGRHRRFSLISDLLENLRGSAIG